MIDTRLLGLPVECQGMPKYESSSRSTQPGEAACAERASVRFLTFGVATPSAEAPPRRAVAVYRLAAKIC